MPPARFVTDTSLDFLARRLRLLGYDVLTLPASSLEGLYQAGRLQGRIVLTLSARHPRRFADVQALALARGDPAASLRAVVGTHDPELPPFSRCTVCNRRLEPRTPQEASSHVPDGVLAAARAFRHCPGCGRWYWSGSHVRRLREWLERALGRPVAIPEAPEGMG